ncbi:MAG: hypothetical protein M3R67_10275 [Acidobacteriota bacterium]|nr:hypothetical protein [Acidobacteriota bacterium]
MKPFARADDAASEANLYYFVPAARSLSPPANCFGSQLVGNGHTIIGNSRAHR